MPSHYIHPHTIRRASVFVRSSCSHFFPKGEGTSPFCHRVLFKMVSSHNLWKDLRQEGWVKLNPLLIKITPRMIIFICLSSTLLYPHVSQSLAKVCWGSGSIDFIDEATPVWLRTILSQHSHWLGDECASRFKQSTNSIHPLQGANSISTLYFLHLYILVVGGHSTIY